MPTPRSRQREDLLHVGRIVNALELFARRLARRGEADARDGFELEQVEDRLQPARIFGMAGARVVSQAALVDEEKRVLVHRASPLIRA